MVLLKQARASVPSKQTIPTYLPPLNEPVTEFTTIFKYLSYMQSLAESVNMPFSNVFLDVGASINACKLIWNYTNVFSNVIVHLGDFHFMKEIFSFVGTMVNGSGFNDVIFQANLCSTESLASVISGSHYNRCWRVYDPFAEALERLLMERFVDESQLAIPDKVIALTESFGLQNDEETIKDEAIFQFYKEYLSFRERCSSGDFG